MEEMTSTTEIANDMDEILAPVMPDSWEGYARLTIHDADLSDEQRQFAEELASRHMNKNPNTNGEAVGKAAVRKAKEKL